MSILKPWYRWRRRRARTNGPKDMVPGCILQMDPDDPRVRVTGSGVSRLPNQADVSTPGTQSVNGSRPALLIGGGMNGHNAIEFSRASSEFLDLVGLTDASNEYTVFAVYDQTSIPFDVQDLLSSSTGNIFAPVGNDGVSVGMNDGTAWRNEVVAKTGEQIVTWRQDAGANETEFYRDGEALGVGTYDGTWAWLNPKIGAFANGLAHFCDLKLSYLLVFNRKLTDAEVARVHEWLAQRFAIRFFYDSVADTFAYQSDEGTDADPVAAWSPAIGTDDDFVQATEIHKPSLGTLGNREALDFDGANDNLDYSGAAGDWAFLHNGAGGSLLIAAANALVSSEVLFSTYNGSDPANTGLEVLIGSNGSTLARIGNGSGVYLVNAATAAGDYTADVMSMYALRIETGAADEFDIRIDGAQVGNGAFVGAASAADPTNLANIGSRIGVALFWEGPIGDVVYSPTRYWNDFETAAIERLAARRFAA